MQVRLVKGHDQVCSDGFFPCRSECASDTNAIGSHSVMLSDDLKHV